MREGDRVDPIAMTLERLEAGAPTGIQDRDRLIVGPRYYLRTLTRESDRSDHPTITVERLYASTPVCFHSRLCSDPVWLFVLEKLSRQNMERAEQKGGRICLQRSILDDVSTRQNKSMRILNQMEKLGF